MPANIVELTIKIPVSNKSIIALAILNEEANARETVKRVAILYIPDLFKVNA